LDAVLFDFLSTMARLIRKFHMDEKEINELMKLDMG
jgi:hypothetical protein